MDFKRKLEKAFQLDTYAIGAGIRNVNRLRWFLQNAPARFRLLAKIRSDPALRRDLRARKQRLKIDHLLAQIDARQLNEIARTYAGGEKSKWTKYLDARKWLVRSTEQTRKLDLVLSPPKDVLDLGCGCGYFLFVQKQLGARVLGVDLEGDPIFERMIRLLRIERIPYAVTKHVSLPDFEGRKFDLITAWMICFNNHDQPETIWGPSDWDFLLDDLAGRLTANGRIVFSLNPQRDGKFYSKKIGKLFETRSDLMDGRLVIFSKPRLDATTVRRSGAIALQPEMPD
jgi:SAM-dependent methyltransferase